MTIYSGEYLPLFLHAEDLGRIKSLEMKLCPNHDFSIKNYFINNNEYYQVKCPKVAILSTEMDEGEIDKEAKSLVKVVTRTYKNISSVVNDDYIFSLGEKGNKLTILAGSGSNENFRENFKKRLAVVFCNLEWIFDNLKNKFDISEFEFYENTYKKMRDRDGSVPCYLSKRYQRLKEKITKA